MNDNILTLNNVALFWQGNFVGLAAGETTIRIKSSRSECNFAEKTGTSEANFLHRISCQAELLLRVSDAQNSSRQTAKSSPLPITAGCSLPPIPPANCG